MELLEELRADSRQPARPTTMRGAGYLWRIMPAKAPLGAVALLVFVATGLLDIDLFSRGSLATLTPVIGVMVLVALGQSLVIGAGGIDLSVPATMSMVGTILVMTSGGTDGSLARGLLVSAAACIVVGIVNGALVEVVGLNALVVTLATGQLIQGAADAYRGELQQVTQVSVKLTDVARHTHHGVSSLLLVALLLALVLSVMRARTTAGRIVEASSVAKAATRSLGHGPTSRRVLVWVMATCLTGTAGVAVSGFLASPGTRVGDPYLLTPIVAVVLGGTAITGGRVQIAGTVLGAVFLVVLQQVFRLEGLSSGLGMVAEGIVLALALGFATLPARLRPRGPRERAEGPPESTPRPVQVRGTR